MTRPTTNPSAGTRTQRARRIQQIQAKAARDEAQELLAEQHKQDQSEQDQSEQGQPEQDQPGQDQPRQDQPEQDQPEQGDTDGDPLSCIVPPPPPPPVMPPWKPVLTENRTANGQKPT